MLAPMTVAGVILVGRPTLFVRIVKFFFAKNLKKYILRFRFQIEPLEKRYPPLLFCVFRMREVDILGVRDNKSCDKSSPPP